MPHYVSNTVPYVNQNLSHLFREDHQKPQVSGFLVA